MSTKQTKLYYFDGRGICEPIRMILSYGGVDFEDIRAPITALPVKLPEDIKSKSRWGQVPLVEFEGKSLTQSLAVTRYFARRFQLVPEDLYQAALCDEYVDTVRDLMSPFTGVALEEDAQKKQERLKELIQNSKTKYLNVFEKIVKSNDGKHLVGHSLTWADIYLAYALQQFHLLMGVSLVQDHPALQSLLTTVVSTPQIKQWIDKRPQTKF